MPERIVAASAGDQAAGLRRLFASAPMTLAVAAREADLLAAYAHIKRAALEQSCCHFRIAITHARSAREAQSVFARLERVAGTYLGVRLEYLGRTEPAPATVSPCSAVHG